MSGQTEDRCHKASQTAWLNQVNNKWERLLYQSGIDWRKSAGLPDEAKEMLVDVNDMEKVSLDGKWISFAGLADAWGM